MDIEEFERIDLRIKIVMKLILIVIILAGYFL